MYSCARSFSAVILRSTTLHSSTVRATVAVGVVTHSLSRTFFFLSAPPLPLPLRIRQPQLRSFTAFPSDSTMASSSVCAVDCSHAPADANGEPIMTDVTFEPRNVGMESKPDSQAVKFSKIVFLGTGSAIPSPGRRNTSAIALMLNNSSTILLDCGEATQHQIMKSQSVNFSKISSILVTHLHGDHCFGIFGLLCTEASQGREEPVLIVGPVGIRLMVTTVLRAAGGFAGFPLQFLELTPEQTYPDLGIINGGLRLEAYPLKHRVASFGYVLREGLKPGAMLVAKAKELGASGKDLGKLKDGLDVTLADGRIVKSSDCVGHPIRSRSIALLQDTFDSTTAEAACKDVDLLIHECTYSANLKEKAIEHGHSTSGMAGEFAAKVNANMLVMTHFSNRYETREQTARKIEAAAMKAAAPVDSGAVTAAAIAAAKKQGGGKNKGKNNNVAAAATESKKDDELAAGAPADALASLSLEPAAAASTSAASSSASSSSSSTVVAPATAAAAPVAATNGMDVLTLDELCAEALTAYQLTHASGASPAGGVHAAEDYLIIDSKQEALIVNPNKDRLFADQLMAM